MAPAWVFTLITNDPRLAAAGGRAGIDRIGIDLEILGKAERQKGRATRISEHRVEDAPVVYAASAAPGRFARINPIHERTAWEIEATLSAGANVLMLPYFHAGEEVELFCRLVGGRALTVGLVETIAALSFVADILRPPLLDEVHFGFTDLGIEMGKSHPEILRDPRFIAATEAARASGRPFGIAGVARPDAVGLPFDPAAFAAGLESLGATRALISRSFFRDAKGTDLAPDVASLRQYLAELAGATALAGPR
jgi:citrate lyase beta subunit